MPLGFQAAQIVHAAGESASALCAPLDVGCHAVVLSVKDEKELRALVPRLAEAGIEFWAIVEMDHPYRNQATAIGIKPTRERAAIRKILSSVPLLRGND